MKQSLWQRMRFAAAIYFVINEIDAEIASIYMSPNVRDIR